MLNTAEEKVLLILEKCQENTDPEAAHGMADGAIVEFVRELGYEAVADAWDAVVPKWYA